MSAILTPLDLRYIDGINWLLTTPFEYDSDLAGRITAPIGFITDFNSTPQILWNILPPMEYGEAGVVHDVMYRAGLTSRLLADQTHREVLRLLHAPCWKVRLFYAGLRAGGGFVWNRYRRAALLPPTKVTK